MAAVYLHNAIYSQPPSEPRDDLAHSRNISTISNATLFTNTTLHSQPTEPLLRPTTNLATVSAYYDQIYQQPRNEDGTPARLRWDESLAFGGNQDPVVEKGKPWQHSSWRPMTRWRRVNSALEFVIIAWAIYNAVRYFLAFSTQDDTLSQTFCLALGTSVGCSLAFGLCAFVLSVLKKKLLTFGLGYRYIRNALRCLSSFCLFVPAVVNFTLVWVWKRSDNPRLDLQTRCKLDVDVVWSVTSRQCVDDVSAWSSWLVLASVRLALTFIITVTYLIISFLHSKRPERSMLRHVRSESYPPTPRDPNSATSLMPSTAARQYPSQSSLEVTFAGESPSRQLSRVRLARSRSSGLSGETTSGDGISFGRTTLTEPVDQDRDMTGFVDRFRSLLSQITQETDEALELSRSDGAPSPDLAQDASNSYIDHPPTYTPNYERDEDDEDDDEIDTHNHPRNNGRSNNVFNLPAIRPTLGYNEFGLPYPPDENVRVLNGVIRRMPTIESMGSGEVTSSIAASSYRHNGSMYTSSRPPTRNTLLSFTGTDYEPTGSGPPSRANSLSVRAEMLAGMSNVNGTSEYGELWARSDLGTRRMSASPTSFLEHPSGGVSNTTASAESYSTGTSGSRGTTSTYHTATMGSSGDSYPPGLRHDGMLTRPSP